MPSPETARSVSAFRVLLVEDEFLIAMELAAILRADGFEVVGPVATVTAALERLQADRPDAAVLDVSLRGERVTPLILALQDQATPFVLASAYLPADLADEPALACARNLGKPTPAAALLAAMREYRSAAAG